ncbi:MAG: carboxylating nicotinate-nucleotide diphosphorylase [Acidobacteriota bacterium]
MTDLPLHLVARVVREALLEDIGPGDLTSMALVGPEARARGVIIAKRDLVLAGLTPARLAFHAMDPATWIVEEGVEGTALRAGAVLLAVEAKTTALLGAERTALNFLGRMCGIATLTRRFVEEVKGTAAAIYDTRKTTPGHRLLERQAVRLGGGRNHRFGLFDGVLIKDNHHAVNGDLAGAITRTRRFVHGRCPIEVEVDDLPSFDAALEAGADIILLDNMSPRELREAVGRKKKWASGGTGKSVLLEASGGISIATVGEVARTGVDRIAIGALTHSAPASDVSLEIVGIG